MQENPKNILIQQQPISNNIFQQQSNENINIIENQNIFSNHSSQNKINQSLNGSNESDQLQDKYNHQIDNEVLNLCEVQVQKKKVEKKISVGINLQTVNSLERQLKKDLQHCVYKKDLILAKEMFGNIKEQLDQIFELTEGEIIENEHMKNKLSKLCHNMNKIEKALLIDNLPYLCSFVEQLNYNSSDMISSQLFGQYQENQFQSFQQNQQKQKKVKSYNYNQYLDNEVQEQQSEYIIDKEYVKPQYKQNQKQQLMTQENEEYLIPEDLQTASLDESDNNIENCQNQKFIKQQKEVEREIKKENISISNNLFNVNNAIRSQSRKDDDVDIYINRIGNNHALPEKNEQNIEYIQKIVFLKQDIGNLVNQVKFYEAFDLYDKLQKLIQLLQQNHPNLEAQTKLLNFQQENKRFFEKLDISKNDIGNAEKWLLKDKGWKVDKKNEKLCIKYRLEVGSPIVILSTQCKMKVPVTNLIALVYEVELYNKWFPFCKSTSCLGNPTNHSKINYLRISPPLLSDREMYMTGFGVDKMESNGHLLICAKSIDLDEQFCKEYNVKIPQETKSVVRGFLTMATFRITPISENESNFELVMHFDGKFNLIPSGIINFVTIKFARLFLDRLESYCKPKKFKDSVWDQQVKKNREFYGWVEETYQKEMKVINKKKEKELQQQQQQQNQKKQQQQQKQKK